MQSYKSGMTPCTPYFCRPRPVPFSLKPKLEAELDWLVETGIMEEVSHSAWASPVVTIPKKDGRVRLCGDYKVSVNHSLHVDQPPFPTPEELFSALTGGQQFSTLDLSQPINNCYWNLHPVSSPQLVLIVICIGIPG